MMKRLLTLAIVAMMGVSVFAQTKYPYLDTKLSYKDRVENLSAWQQHSMHSFSMMFSRR